VRGPLPRRHKADELASVAATGSPRGRAPIRHEREEFARLARRLGLRRADGRGVTTFSLRFLGGPLDGRTQPAPQSPTTRRPLFVPVTGGSAYSA